MSNCLAILNGTSWSGAVIRETRAAVLLELLWFLIAVAVSAPPPGQVRWVM